MMMRKPGTPVEVNVDGQKMRVIWHHNEDFNDAMTRISRVVHKNGETSPRWKMIRHNPKDGWMDMRGDVYVAYKKVGCITVRLHETARRRYYTETPS